jgi:hypothetical protein
LNNFALGFMLLVEEPNLAGYRREAQVSNFAFADAKRFAYRVAILAQRLVYRVPKCAERLAYMVAVF